MKKIIIPALAALLAFGCSSKKEEQEHNMPFIWEGANVYFMLTDRFNNGDESNDLVLNRTKETAKLRGFEGGDIRGIIQKIDEGYFDELGINAIWFTPVVEQIHDATNEGTGNTYGFHGYWAKDWTKLDPNFGAEEDLSELVEKAHAHGIRVMLDGVINHTGPVTDIDEVWPSNWVRTEPQCEYDNYENTTTCTLVKNLPDVMTESNEPVELPSMLVEKWRSEGRYEQEVKELDAFFERTGYPRAPKYYIIKWLTDYITDYGIDAYRADTVKHLGAEVWATFSKECDYAFTEWKKANPNKVLDNNTFFTVGEVYNYGISGGQYFDFGDKKVNYYKNGFDALINFQMKWDIAQKSKEEVFKSYSNTLNNELGGNTVLNYISSHDDGSPFDAKREKTYKSAEMLLLTPGISQVYYGDETGRSLDIPDTEGDATLRSFMNWEDINKPETKTLLAHWQKLGRFRKNHPSVGAGEHIMVSESPYVFKRTFTKGDYNDSVLVGLDLLKGNKTISVGDVFVDGTKVRDAYSGTEGIVENNNITFDTPYTILLIEKID
ncbi:MAG: alpha-amlyase [Flavobacterium sp. MedPE-SWcel]|uniref:alpha-amylase family glycosyl hydrolase n=1 Tax=uncultured Flavobacterium sp. TaxID=165435 RepID=UPI00091F6F24|nr:alpha-amylase family glycosyl hydrolase [uncultured Flavobacterium sp.]OIQ17620.1 MAG: alpha-amlyase [Flavobacterium sp. MedPE-SWcel]